MFDRVDPIPLEATVPAANRVPAQAARLPLRPVGCHAFTLAELLVSMGVLVLLVLLFTQLLNSAASIITLGHNKWTPTHKRDSSLIECPSISRSW